MTKDDDDKNESDDNQVVGFGNPPKKYQFRKGQSGNPGGRPPGGRPKDKVEVTKCFEKVLAAKVPVKENGKERMVAKLELMIRRSIDEAIRKGDYRAVRSILADAKEFGVQIMEPVESGPIYHVTLPAKIEDVDLWVDICAPKNYKDPFGRTGSEIRIESREQLDAITKDLLEKSPEAREEFERKSEEVKRQCNPRSVCPYGNQLLDFLREESGTSDVSEGQTGA